MVNLAEKLKNKYVLMRNSNREIEEEGAALPGRPDPTWWDRHGDAVVAVVVTVAVMTAATAVGWRLYRRVRVNSIRADFPVHI